MALAATTAAAMAEARAMAAVKVMRVSNNDDNNATARRRDDADDANDDADGEGRRKTDDVTARRWRGVVLPTSPDGRRGAQLHPAATAPRHQDNNNGR